MTFANQASDVPSHAEVSGCQVDVESNEDIACADRNRARALMHRDVSDVGRAGRLRAYVSEQAALRSQRGLAVIIGRDAKTLPDLRPGLMCQRDCLRHGCRAQRNERQHVERPHPRVQAPVSPQVDAIERDLPSLPRDRQDAAIVRGVARAVQHACAATLHRRDAEIERSRNAPLGDVRYALEDSRAQSIL